jgi:hypothetical protein
VDCPGQKQAVPTFETEQRERLPRLANQREHRECGRLQGQPQQERVAPTDAVDRRARQEPRAQRGHAAEGKREARLGERDPAHVVQVDDDEREGDPVSESVDDTAYLDQPDLSRQVRVELAEVRGQRAHLRRRCPSEMTGRPNCSSRSRR